MPIFDEHEQHGHEPEEVDASKGYEDSDVKVTGIVVFLVSLAIFVGVMGLVAWGIGKGINYVWVKQDGPNNHWTAQEPDIRKLGQMPNNPEMQNRVAELTNKFPEPRVQIDDGNQDVADLHAREDLLLDHYSWVDKSQGKVRIPIERAMALVAERGLPVAPAVASAPLMTGDKQPQVTAPLTTGFARTGYEQDQARAADTEKQEGK